MDLPALRAELTVDAAGLGYSGMTDAQAAAALNATTIAVKIDIPADTMRAALMIRGAAIWDKIADAAAAHAQPAVKTAAQGFVDAVKFMQAAWPTSDPATLAAYAARLDGFVTASPAVLTNAQRNAALALADATISRAAQLGWPVVQEGDVAAARAS